MSDLWCRLFWRRHLLHTVWLTSKQAIWWHSLNLSQLERWHWFRPLIHHNMVLGGQAWLIYNICPAEWDTVTQGVGHLFSAKLCPPGKWAKAPMWVFRLVQHWTHYECTIPAGPGRARSSHMAQTAGACVASSHCLAEHRAGMRHLQIRQHFYWLKMRPKLVRMLLLKGSEMWSTRLAHGPWWVITACEPKPKKASMASRPFFSS